MEDRRSTVSIKATAAFTEWLGDLADHIGSDVSTLIELGLRQIAVEASFPAPPPRIDRIRRRREAAR